MKFSKFRILTGDFVIAQPSRQAVKITGPYCPAGIASGKGQGSTEGHSSITRRDAGRLLTSLIWMLSLVVFVGCATVAETPETKPEALILEKSWPHETSDLEKDPATEFGRLPNGMGFVLKTNHTPKERVSMHLYVQAGSLAERAGEEGMAHFMEHMAFNGSEHFPPGEMVKYFQRIGMQFGPDANAHTGFAQTVYDILLPQGDAKSISEGLLVLRDYAQGALLLPEEVEKEKGVVLAEKRSRDSVAYRTFKETLAFEVPGTLIARRLPIGTESSIRSFDADTLRAFYHAWYQPERLTIVMVGPFDKDLARRLIEEQFADLNQLGEDRQLPDVGRFVHKGTEVFYHYEKEAGNTSVSIESVVEQPSENDSFDVRKQQLMQELAVRAVQKRLDELQQDPNSVMTSANARSGEYLRQFRYAEVAADCKPENWEDALSTIERALRQTLEYGFTPSELQNVKNEYIAELQKDVNEENTTDSKVLARQIMDSIGEREVYQSPTQRQQMLAPLITSATVAQVHEAFKKVWAPPHRLVLVTGNADLASEKRKPENKILAAYQKSLQVAVQAPVEKENQSFPYLAVPQTAGDVDKQQDYEDLGIEEVVFSNGFRLLLKQTDFSANEVKAALSFGGGKASEPEDKPGISHLTQEVVNESGFGKMDRIELENALAGKLAEISLRVGEDRFIVRGTAASNQLETLFQLMQSFILDPAYRPDALGRVMKRFDEHYNAFSHTVEGAMQMKGLKFLAGGDSRFGWPSREQMHRVDVDDIAQWFGTQLAKAPLELAIVGDFDKEALLNLAGRYFGTLEKREMMEHETVRSAPVFPASKSSRLSVDTAIEKALVTISYPTGDFWDIGRTRRLNTLSDVFSERLRLSIREKLGAAYSPYAYHRPFRAYRGFGYLQSVVVVNPSLTATIVSAVEQIANELVAKGISQDELRRSLDPTLTKIKDMRRTNDYWINSVMSGAGRHPEQLSWARTIDQDYAAISVEEIDALARQYLNNSKSARIIIVPEKKQSAEANTKYDK